MVEGPIQQAATQGTMTTELHGEFRTAVSAVTFAHDRLLVFGDEGVSRAAFAFYQWSFSGIEAFPKSGDRPVAMSNEHPFLRSGQRGHELHVAYLLALREAFGVKGTLNVSIVARQEPYA